MALQEAHRGDLFPGDVNDGLCQVFFVAQALDLEFPGLDVVAGGEEVLIVQHLIAPGGRAGNDDGIRRYGGGLVAAKPGQNGRVSGNIRGNHADVLGKHLVAVQHLQNLLVLVSVLVEQIQLHIVLNPFQRLLRFLAGGGVAVVAQILPPAVQVFQPRHRHVGQYEQGQKRRHQKSAAAAVPPLGLTQTRQQAVCLFGCFHIRPRLLPQTGGRPAPELLPPDTR